MFTRQELVVDRIALMKDDVLTLGTHQDTFIRDLRLERGEE